MSGSDEKEVRRNIRELERLIPDRYDTRKSWNFGEIWGQIRSTTSSFKGAQFQSAQVRRELWEHHQTLVEQVKKEQERRKEQFQDRLERSRKTREDLIFRAENILPFDSAIFDMVVAVGTAGIYHAAKFALDAILGSFDARKMELLDANMSMRSLRQRYKEHQREMLRDDQDAVWEKIQFIQSKLDKLWADYNDNRKKALDEHYAEKKEKHERWRARTQENIRKNERKKEKAEAALDRQQDNLSKLQDMMSDARSDEHRDRVSGWIDEAHDKISDIEDSIERIRGWIAEDEDRLSS